MAIFLASCGTVGNRVTDTGKTKELTEHGVALVKFDRDVTVGANAFELLISPINPSTGLIYGSTPEGIYTSARGIAGVTNPNWPQDKYWAFTLVPGEYAVSKIRQLPSRNQNNATGQTYTGPIPAGAGIAAVALLGITMLVLGGMVVAEAVEDAKRTDEDRMKNPNGEILFIDSDSEKRSTPKFRIEAGKVTYLGDILIMREARMIHVDDEKGQELASDDTEREPGNISDVRTFVTYGFDEGKAMNYSQKIGLGSTPWTPTRLAALSVPELNLVNIRRWEAPDNAADVPADKKEAKQVPAPKAPVNAYKKAKKIDAAPTAGPAPPSPSLASSGKTSLKALMKAFLSGEITKSEYDAKRGTLR